MECGYHARGECRSCTGIGVPIVQQRADKQARARAAVAVAADGERTRWLEPFGGPEADYRNKAKMVVGGTVDAPTLGILGADRHGVDLRGCGIMAPGLREAMPALAAFITTARLTPYDVPNRRGELKHLLVTQSPDGELMVRFVLRSTEALPRIRKHLVGLLAAAPIRVVTANILPAHAAVLEGDEEHVLTAESALPMRLGALTLRLPPRSFFQTNTAVAQALYQQAAVWAEAVLGTRRDARPGAVPGNAGTAGEVGPAEASDAASAADTAGTTSPAVHDIVDLYCGVGGFALTLAGPGRRVLGIESSADAVAAAEATAVGLPDVAFLTGDATRWLADAAAIPDLVIVNPPRRGLGDELTATLQRSGAPTVIYSSCNPDTLARDLERLPAYRPVEARLFDMFPQTDHLEVMVLLQR